MTRFTAVTGVALLALLSIAVLVYGGGRMATPTVSADGHGHDEMTRAYVDGAIEYYSDKGLTKTVRHYGNPLSWEGGRYLIVADAHTHVLVSSPLLYLNGKGVDALVPGGGLGDEIDKATATGHWFDGVGLNMLSGEREPARYFVRTEDGLAFMSARFGDMAAGSPTDYEPDEPAKSDEELTREYVFQSVAYYEANGREATLAYYNSPESVEGERSLLILREGDLSILSSVLFRRHVGTNSFTGPGTPMGGFLQQASADGYSFKSFYLNPATQKQEPALYFAVAHDGLVFVSAHSIVSEDAADIARDYVRKAIAMYDQAGLDATVKFYDSMASVDGQFYLFMIDEDDLYIAHPIFPTLKGTDIKNVTDAAGYNLGEEIAKANEEGIWVDYLWLNPVSGREENKRSWAIRHDGIIFASGYYTPKADDESPPDWLGADPRDYTVDYVEQAIARYERDGRDGLVNYYSSVISFDGQWYMFIVDASDDDRYIAHPLLSNLVGTDIKKVSSSDNPDLGEEIAAATAEGVWVEYLWPHPFTMQDAPKIAYARRYGDLIFASGYYVNPDDPRAYTQEYVAEAIAYYDSEGFDSTVERYNDSESVRYGLWRLNIYDERGTVLTEPIHPHRVGTSGRKVLDLGVTRDGQWVEGPAFNPLAPELNRIHRWFVAHDGLIFQSSYTSSSEGREYASEPDDDSITRAYVMDAIERYESEGREATVEYYQTAESGESDRYMTIIDADTHVLLTSPLRPAAVGVRVPQSRLGPDPDTEEGVWYERQGNNPVTGQREPRRVFHIMRDGLIFIASHSALQENVAQAAQNYVDKAVKFYDREGLDATIAHYDSRESVDGQFYLFLIGADDIYLAHPIFPHLKGRDIKDVVGSDGQELGKEIAQATEDGIWVEYLWFNPVTESENNKVTWALRHDGLIFASGYYTGGGDVTPPAWRDADPREYTVDYVNRAVERYERDGLEALKAYYNSVAAFEGQWYLFATDANDIYHIHPLLPRLIGTDIKDVVGADGYELGKEIAKATEEGHWIEYIWPHPSTLKNAPKVSYAVRRDGMIFASGYYPEPEDPAAYTKAYVQKAIDYYDENGLEATVAHYNSENSFEGQWYLGLADSDSRILVSAVVPRVIGSPLNPEAVRAIDAGQWVEIEWFGNLTAGNTFRHIWGTRHDGLYFYSGYFAEQGTPLPDAGD